jgi:hypothetical protein
MNKLPVGLQILHRIIIINFLLEIGYGGYMVFFEVGKDKGGGGPLFGKAAEFDFETMMVRRMYAAETWIAIAGLSAYLGVTEFLPRLLKPRRFGLF